MGSQWGQVGSHAYGKPIIMSLIGQTWVTPSIADWPGLFDRLKVIPIVITP